MSDDWKTRDRPCPPCANCGTELYEKFWGAGGWAQTDTKTGKGHGESDCIASLRLDLQDAQMSLQHRDHDLAAARLDLEGTENTAALTVSAQEHLAKSARSLAAVLAEARIEYEAMPEHVRAVIRQGAAMRRLLDERFYGERRRWQPATHIGTSSRDLDEQGRCVYSACTHPSHETPGA